MTFLKKRETPVQNIAYIAIMAAINVVFVLISSALPILFILLVFILPLTSVIVTLYCKKLYVPIYAVTTLALCFGVSAGFSIFDTFIYVLPSLITGILFGLLIEKNVPSIYMIVGMSVVQYLLTSLTFLFINNVITQVNFFNSIYNMIGLSNFQFKGVLTDIFTYIIAEIQVVLTYIVIKYGLKRVGDEINLDIKYRFILYVALVINGIIMTLSHFYFPNYSVLITLIALPIAIYLLIDLLLKKNVAIYSSLGFLVIMFSFIFALLYPYVHAPNHLSLIYIFFIGVTIIDTLFNYCFKAKAKNIE